METIDQRREIFYGLVLFMHNIPEHRQNKLTLVISMCTDSDGQVEAQFWTNICEIAKTASRETGKKWNTEEFVCKFSNHAHPGVHSCPAMMRIRTKIDLSEALIQTARAHNNHRPLKEDGLSLQMKEQIANHKDKTASQIRRDIQIEKSKQDSKLRGLKSPTEKQITKQKAISMVAGFSDANKRFHPTVIGICSSESKFAYEGLFNAIQVRRFAESLSSQIRLHARDYQFTFLSWQWYKVHRESFYELRRHHLYESFFRCSCPVEITDVLCKHALLKMEDLKLVTQRQLRCRSQEREEGRDRSEEL
uniref:SWIM-type domain-containing protein n=1 Tax=Ditylenchus dipsaci TaxID=166011 RepID=A0A915D8R6_9BILA